MYCIFYRKRRKEHIVEVYSKHQRACNVLTQKFTKHIKEKTQKVNILLLNALFECNNMFNHCNFVDDFRQNAIKGKCRESYQGKPTMIKPCSVVSKTYNKLQFYVSIVIL